MAMIGVKSWRVLTSAACTRPIPFCMWRETFSTTTIASSTTMPTDSTMASRVSRFREKPMASIVAAAPISEIGMVTRGTRALRQDPRKRNTMRPTMSTVSLKVLPISFSEFSM
jgi:hypothetical protein